MEPRRPIRIAERAKIEQHRHASSGLAGMDKGFSYEDISEPMCTVRWVRDDVLSKGFVRFKEVAPPCPIASVDEIRRHYLVSCGLEYLGDGSIAASRLPNISFEALHGQKRPCSLWWSWIKFIRSTLRIAKTSGRNF